MICYCKKIKITTRHDIDMHFISAGRYHLSAWCRAFYQSSKAFVRRLMTTNDELTPTSASTKKYQHREK